MPPHGSQNSEPLLRTPQPGGVHPRLTYPLPGDVASGRSRATWPCFCSGNILSRIRKGPGSPGPRGTQRAGRCVLEGGSLQRMKTLHRPSPCQQLWGRFWSNGWLQGCRMKATGMTDIFQRKYVNSGGCPSPVTRPPPPFRPPALGGWLPDMHPPPVHRVAQSHVPVC